MRDGKLCWLISLGLVWTGVVGCTPQWAALFRGEVSLASPEPAPEQQAPVVVERAPVAAVDRRSGFAPKVAAVRPPAESQRLEGTSGRELQDKIWAHFTEHIGRHLHVQTDKALYRPQETVWIKTWDVQLRSMRGFALDTGLLYQLVSPRGEVVAHKVVRQVFGEGTNELTIPAGASSGEYLIRVVTEDDVSTVRPIVVVGGEASAAPDARVSFGASVYRPGQTVSVTVSVDPSKLGKLRRKPQTAVVQIDGATVAEVPLVFGRDGKAEGRFGLPAQMAWGQGTITASLVDGAQTLWVAATIPIDNSGVQLWAYPEGGKLVAGLPSRVYFEARDGGGAPVAVSGWVEDDQGRQVTPIAAVHEGRGRFELRPEAGRTYRAVLTSPEGAGPFPLPATAEAGCVLSSIDDFDTERSSVRVMVRCHEPTAVLVTAMLRETLVDVAYVLADAATPAVVFLRSKDPELGRAQGAMRVTVWDDWMSPLAERLVYRNPRTQLDLQVIPKDAVVAPGEDVELHVFARTFDGEPVAAKVALSMVDAQVLDVVEDDYGTILSHLFLEPELVGPLRDVSQYFDPTNPKAGEHLDLLMGTRGYRAFEWQAIVEPREREGGPRVGTSGAIVVQAPDFGGKATSAGMVSVRPGGLARAARVAERLGGLDPRYGQLPVVIEPVVEVSAGGSAPAGASTPTPAGEAPAEGGPSEAGPKTHLSRADVLSTVQRYQGKVGRCSRGATGVVSVRMTVMPDGHVEKPEVVNEARGTELAACVVKVVGTFKFPSWTGSPLALTFPFVMEGQGWSPVRVFAVPPVDRDLASRTADRRETVLWMPEVKLDDAGHGVIRVPTSSVATTFRAVAEGIGAGLVGRGEAEVTTQMPWRFEASPPAEVVMGDEVVFPITLESLVDAPQSVDVLVQTGAGLERVEGGGRTVKLAARGQHVEWVRLRARSASEATFVEVVAQSGSVRRASQQQVVVSTAGYRRASALAGLVTAPVKSSLPFEAGEGAGATSARVYVFPNESGILRVAREGLSGRGEGGVWGPLARLWVDAQTLAWLQSRGGGEASLRAALREDAAASLEALRAYGVEGGVAAFGGMPADVVQGALALVALSSLRSLQPEAVEARIEELVEHVRGRRDGAGSYRREAFFEGPGQPSKAVVDAVVTWGVTVAGATGFEAEQDALVRAAAETKDAFVLALATDVAWSVPRLRAGGLDHCRKLAGLQDGSGAWLAFDHTAWRHGAGQAPVVTTALALRALTRCGGFLANQRRAAAWLAGQQRADGTWGDGVATNLALDALVRYGAAGRRAPGAGTVTVTVGGGAAQTLAFDPRSLDVARLDLGVVSGASPAAVELAHTGRGELGFLLALTGVQSAPEAPTAPLVGATLALDRATARVGETTTLTVEVTHSGEGVVPIVLVTIGLPAGLALAPEQLGALHASGVSAELDRERRVLHLALPNVGAGESRKIAVPLLARAAGIFTGSSSRVEVLGREETRVVLGGVKVSVSP